jgi:hypothetical protein
MASKLSKEKEPRKPLSPRSIGKDLKTLEAEINKELDQKRLREEIKKRLTELPIDKLDPPLEDNEKKIKEWENTPHTSFGIYIYNAGIYFITRIDDKKYYIQTLDNEMMIIEGVSEVMKLIKDGDIVIITQVTGNKNPKKIEEKLIYNWERFRKDREEDE